MKATDGDELRYRISKDFEMVGKGKSWKDRGRSVRHAGLLLHTSIKYSEKLCANESQVRTDLFSSLQPKTQALCLLQQ